MPLILETQRFTVTVHDKPHHSRENGGHIKVSPKGNYANRHEMPLEEAASLMHLTMIVGEAATTVLRQKGIDVIRINYQDNGNWAYLPQNPTPLHLHIHLYIRTSHERHPQNDPRFQAFPEALVFPPRDSGYYDSFVPLTEDDCIDIKKKIEHLLQTDKYKTVKL